MTSDNDKKAAEEYCDNHKCHLQMACHVEAFLAGCEHKRAEVIAEVKAIAEKLANQWGGDIAFSDLIDELDKLERGA